MWFQTKYAIGDTFYTPRVKSIYGPKDERIIDGKLFVHQGLTYEAVIEKHTIIGVEASVRQNAPHRRPSETYYVLDDDSDDWIIEADLDKMYYPNIEQARIIAQSELDDKVNASL